MLASIRENHIRQARTKDLNLIKPWLAAEKQEEKVLCNYNILEQNQLNSQVMVYIDANNYPIGCLCYDKYDFAINDLHVCMHNRGKGIARLLLQAYIKFVVEHNSNIIMLPIVPQSSIKFWSKMGFNFYLREKWHYLTAAHLSTIKSPKDTIGYKILPATLHVPDRSTQFSPITIRFYSEKKTCNFNKNIAVPIAEFKPPAVIDNTTIFLKNKFVFFDGFYCEGNDSIVAQIIISGKQFYLDKIRSEQDTCSGLFRKGCGIYLEKIKNYYLSRYETTAYDDANNKDHAVTGIVG